MDLHLIAAACGPARALNGFAPSPIDRQWFRAITTMSTPTQNFDEALYLLRKRPRLDSLSRYLETWRDRWRFWKHDPTDQSAVIVGKTTWQTDLHHGTLPARHTIVLSRTVDASALIGDLSAPCRSQWWCGSLGAALTWAASLGCPHAWITGGEQVYREALAVECSTAYRCRVAHHTLRSLIYPIADLYLTEIDAEAPDATVFLPPLDGWQMQAATPWIEEDGRSLRFTRWTLTPSTSSG